MSFIKEHIEGDIDSSSTTTSTNPRDISNMSYDKDPVRARAQTPMIEEEHQGDLKARLARLKTEQATMLRKKHVPAHLLDQLEKRTLKDVSERVVGPEFNLGRTLKPVEKKEGGVSEAHHISSKAYDEIYEKEKGTPQESELVTSNNPGGSTMRRQHKEPFTLEERLARLKTEQATMLRAKHVPQRLQPYLKNHNLKDTTRGVNVGFEYNFKEAGKKIEAAKGEPSKAFFKSNEQYDEIYKKTKMTQKRAEVKEERAGTIKDRRGSIRNQTGRSLRQKHLPDRLKNVELKDLPGQRTVGFEYNMYGESARREH